MAQRASTPELASLLVDLSKNWMQLANELERIEDCLKGCRPDLKRGRIALELSNE